MSSSRSILGLLWLLALAFAPTPALGQSGGTSRVSEIRRALQEAELQAAAALADSAIAHFEKFLPEELAEIHALRALTYFEQGQPVRAEEHLVLALQLEPDLQLDPVFFSPKIRGRLDELRERAAAADRHLAPTVHYVVVPDPRLQAAWRSLLLPGWGQRFKGQRGKGRFFSISASALGAATLTAHILRERAEDRYAAAGEDDVVDRYKALNRYHLLRNNLALALGVVWGIAVLDALITPGHPEGSRIGIAMPRDSGMAAMVSVAVSF